MIRIGSLLILVVAVILAAQSCTKTKNDNCPFLAPDMVFVGFTEDESDTMVIRRFEKNSDFTTLLDTILINRGNLKRIAVGKDSIRLVPGNYPMLAETFYVHDWQLYLPGAGKTVEIRDAVTKFTKEKSASSTCHSFVTSVRFDRQNYDFVSWFDTPYRVFANR